MKIIPFLPQHVVGMDLQQAQLGTAPVLDIDYGIYLYKGGPAFSCIEGDVIIATGGAIRLWANRASAWALLTPAAGRHMNKITRAVIRFLEVQPEVRIETTVDEGFEGGHRWAKLLGFKHEGFMEKYIPNGHGAHLYARIK